MNAAHRGAYAPKYVRRALRHHFHTAAGDAAICGTFEESARLCRIVSFFDSSIVMVPPEFLRDVKAAALSLAERFEEMGHVEFADDAKKFVRAFDTNYAM